MGTEKATMEKPKNGTKFNPLVAEAYRKAQEKFPKKDLSELVAEASEIYEALKKEGKTERGETFTRASAIASVLKETPTMPKKDVVIKADEMYLAKNPKAKSNLRETEWEFALVYHALKIFGHVS
jgi:hypothetical protein